MKMEPLDFSSPPEVARSRAATCLANATSFLEGKRWREAEVELLRALALLPHDLRALKLLALVRFKLGRLDEAEAVCRELVAAEPDDASMRLKLGLIALKLDRPDDAVRELETAAKLAPEDTRVWTYLGFAYARIGQAARARTAFARAGQDALADQIAAPAIAVAAAPAQPEATPARASDGAAVASDARRDEDHDPELGKGLRLVVGPPSAAPVSETVPAQPPQAEVVVPASEEPDASATAQAATLPAEDPRAERTAEAAPPAPAAQTPSGEATESSESVPPEPSVAVEAAQAPAPPEDPGAAALGEGRLVAPGLTVFETAFGLEPLADFEGEDEEASGPTRGEGDAKPDLRLASSQPVLSLLSFTLSRLGALDRMASERGSAAVSLAFAGELHARAAAVVAVSGAVKASHARRREQGRVTDARLGEGELAFVRFEGAGEITLAEPAGVPVTLALADDILYLRLHRLVAFDAEVLWEAGRIPRTALEMVQFRGDGRVVMALVGHPTAIKVTVGHPVTVSAASLVGWAGRIVARGLEIPGFLHCEGEGVVLADLFPPLA